MSNIKPSKINIRDLPCRGILQIHSSLQPKILSLSLSLSLSLIALAKLTTQNTLIYSLSTTTGNLAAAKGQKTASKDLVAVA